MTTDVTSLVGVKEVDRPSELFKASLTRFPESSPDGDTRPSPSGTANSIVVEKSHGEVLRPGYRGRHKLKSVPVPDNDKQTLI